MKSPMGSRLVLSHSGRFGVLRHMFDAACEVVEFIDESCGKIMDNIAAF